MSWLTPLSTKRATKAALVVLCVAALLVWRVVFMLGQEDTLRPYVGTTAVVVGTVAGEPDLREAGVRAVVRVQRVNGRAVRGTLMAVLPKDTPLAYGDGVELRGLVEAPQSFETDTGRVFDYAGYLRVRGVTAVLQRAVLRAQEEGPPSLMRGLFAVKHRFERALERALPEPQASLMEGILLGERGGFPQELLQMFIVVGLIHIVVLSGSNISIVAEGVFRALGFLPRTLTFAVGGTAIVLFVLMTGSGAAAVRALVMAAIGLTARYLRRPELALRSLGVAGVGMLLWNPLFIGEQGFVLSFLATFGLITAAPYVETKLPRVPAWARFNLRSVVASTIAVEVFLLPALLYYSGVLSLVALPVNVLVLPFVWVVMLGGFITGLVGLLSATLALVPALATNALLSALLWITHTAAALPFAATVAAPFPVWVAVLAYVPLIVTAFRMYYGARVGVNG